MNDIVFMVSVILIFVIPILILIKAVRKMRRYLGESVEDKYPDEKFNLEWFCHNPPIPEKNGRVFGVPARAVFEALASRCQQTRLSRCLVAVWSLGRTETTTTRM